MPDTNSVSPANSHTPPSCGSHRRGLIAACFLFVGCVFGLAQAARAQQPAPLVVDADQVTYDQVLQQVEATGNVRLQYRGIRLTANHVVFDLRQERLVARGDVVLIDQQGRELRGQSLTYDVRTDQAELFKADTVISRVFVRSERLQTMARRILGQDATLTTCDPARPAYRITAAQLEIIPGDRIIARRATLWVGQFRVLALPVLILSLRSPEETALSLPRFGYNYEDGAWLDYTYRYDLGSLPATLYFKYGSLSGSIVRGSLGYTGPRGLTATMTVGRNQDSQMRIFDQAELVLALPDLPLGRSVALSTSVRGGFFREQRTGVESSRVQYAIGFSTPVFRLSPQTSWQASGSLEDSFYGIGARQTIVRSSLVLTHQINKLTSMSLSYGRQEVVSGASPFLFDTIPVRDQYHRISFEYSRAGFRGRDIGTGLGAGVGYSFRDQTVSVKASYSETVAERYHWGFGAEYNLTTRALKLTTNSGLALGHGTYFTVQAIYLAHDRVFEDLDYILTSRICDCVDISLKYRQVRQEIWLTIGITGLPRGEFLLPARP